jgi:hypothetical protein
MFQSLSPYHRLNAAFQLVQVTDRKTQELLWFKAVEDVVKASEPLFEFDKFDDYQN